MNNCSVGHAEARSLIIMNTGKRSQVRISFSPTPFPPPIACRPACTLQSEPTDEFELYGMPLVGPEGRTAMPDELPA